MKTKLERLITSFPCRAQLIPVTVSLVVVSCGSLNDRLAESDLGIALRVASGAGQFTSPDTFYKEPLSVQVFDTATGVALEGVQVDFQEVGAWGATISNPSGSSDANGIVSTKVKASSSALNGQIAARIHDSKANVIFDLQTADVPSGKRFIVSTTGRGAETAGVPFGLSVTLGDENGNVFDFNELVNFVWNISYTQSWSPTSITPTMSCASSSCQFNHGQCDLPSTCVLTDARNPATVEVRDDGNRYSSFFPFTIRVSKRSATNLAIASHSGGPDGSDGVPGTSDDAVAYTQAQIFDADTSPQNYYAALTDNAGNYISGPVGGVAWGLTNFSNSLSSSIGPSTSFSVGVVGSGTLSATSIGYTSKSLPVIVDPGAPHHLAVSTEHIGAESAGKEFKLTVLVKDQKDNTVAPNISDGSGGYYKNIPVTFTTTRAGFSGAGWDNRFFAPAQGDTYWINLTVFAGATASYSLSQATFQAGAMVDLIKAIATDVAPASKPTISATVFDGALTLSGNTQATISLGQPAYVAVFTSPSDPLGYTCSLRYANDATSSCLQLLSGDNTVYANLVDMGGNIIQNVNATWTGSGVWAGRLQSGTGTSNIINVNQSGSGSLKLQATYNSVTYTTTWFGSSP